MPISPAGGLCRRGRCPQGAEGRDDPLAVLPAWLTQPWASRAYGQRNRSVTLISWWSARDSSLATKRGTGQRYWQPRSSVGPARSRVFHRCCSHYWPNIAPSV